MADGKKELVLVTGGSGFIAVYCIAKALSLNYRVRATLRSLKREADVRQMLVAANATSLENLSFVEANLERDDGWEEAVEGCAYVLHVASPFPSAPPKHDDDLIVPAREGTLRVLRAARNAGVKRIVLTSSLAAVVYGHRNWDVSKPFTEKEWTDPKGPKTNAYYRSKTIAERAAWDFIEREGGSLELSVVNPGAVFGPVLGPDFSPSILIITYLLNGQLPACPKMSLLCVDVRDVAELHLLAMTDPKAKGERFLCIAPPAMSARDVSLTLRKSLGDAAKRCPTHDLPDFLLRLVAIFDPSVKLVLPELGEVKQASADKAKDLLGWEPRSVADSVLATAESLIKLKLVKT